MEQLNSIFESNGIEAGDLRIDSSSEVWWNDADACYMVLFHSERIINKLSGLLVGKMLMHSFYELIGDDRYSTYCCEVS